MSAASLPVAFETAMSIALPVGLYLALGIAIMAEKWESDRVISFRELALIASWPLPVFNERVRE